MNLCYLRLNELRLGHRTLKTDLVEGLVARRKVANFAKFLKCVDPQSGSWYRGS